jgi:hypothetical protein
MISGYIGFMIMTFLLGIELTTSLITGKVLGGVSLGDLYDRKTQPVQYWGSFSLLAGGFVLLLTFSILATAEVFGHRII